jgi:hypothetical protein
MSGLTQDQARDLLDLAKQRHLPASDLERVVAELADPARTANRYTLLHIVGKGGGPRFRTLVEAYLDSPEDPMLARLALQILCRFWGLTADYLVDLRRFLKGVDWDDEQDVRLIAASVAGEYLERHDDAELAHELLRLSADGDGNRVLRDSAVRGLARAIGTAPSDMPPASRMLPTDGDWERDVLARARERFG